MRFTRMSLLIGAAAALAVGTLSAAPATAAPAFVPDRAASLVSSLGTARTAGVYIDASGKTVVTVTDQAAADSIRAAGGTARLVTRSSAQLTALQSRLDAGVPGTAWSIDPVTNQVVISADATVSPTALAALQTAVSGSAGGARIERAQGVFKPLISGGDAIYGGQYRCSLGFNVVKGGVYYFLTAGHCGNVASTWYSNSSHTTVLGTNVESRFPGDDYAMVKYTNTSITISGTVGSQDITSAANPTVGEAVKRRGSTTGIHSGTVQALNTTVHYSTGETVNGLIQTNVCAEGGDSGGPLYDGTKALGLTSGGSGNCTSGGTTFFQPVVEALNHFGASVF